MNVPFHRGPRLDTASILRRFRGFPEAESFNTVGKVGWLPGLGLPSAGVRFPPSNLLPDPLGKIGNLELRLARTPAEVRQAQKLRFEVFYQERGAVASPSVALARRDMDEYDAICDHLLVLDHADGIVRFGERHPRIVGTYRLLRQDVAAHNWGFYTQGEFDIAPLLARHSTLKFLELGRSCVKKAYRDKRTVELLWHGIWAYILAHDIDAMVGCASFDGTNPEALALPLSYLHHYHRAPPDWQARATAKRGVAMDQMPRDAIDPKAALRTLPPLIKGYLRLGAYIGDGAVVDRAFGTTDVLVILPRAVISPRYVDYYGADASRHRSS